MSGHSISVLVVDDDSAVRETTAGLLEDTCKVTQSASGPDALRLLQSSRFDVVCTDYRMPGMTGTELMRRAKQLYPSIGWILVTAYADYPSYQAELRSGSCLLLLKPYEAEQLTGMVLRSARIARTKQVAADAFAEVTRTTSEASKRTR